MPPQSQLGLLPVVKHCGFKSSVQGCLLSSAVFVEYLGLPAVKHYGTVVCYSRAHHRSIWKKGPSAPVSSGSVGTGCPRRQRTPAGLPLCRVGVWGRADPVAAHTCRPSSAAAISAASAAAAAAAPASAAHVACKVRGGGGRGRVVLAHSGGRARCVGKWCVGRAEWGHSAEY
eukprot:364888-Chlamydomonas_euryale.AAC.8